MPVQVSSRFQHKVHVVIRFQNGDIKNKILNNYPQPEEGKAEEVESDKGEDILDERDDTEDFDLRSKLLIWILSLKTSKANGTQNQIES